jgi:hypothetical protein
MAHFTRATSTALLLLAGGLMVAGCAADGSDNIFTTGALGTQPQQQQVAAAPEARIDPVCVTLTSRIDTLRKEGIADKIEKAAAKKYKMTQADLGKADQLTKASAEFQVRCSTIMPRTAASPSVAPPPSVAAAPPAAPKVLRKATAQSGDVASAVSP